MNKVSVKNIEALLYSGNDIFTRWTNVTRTQRTRVYAKLSYFPPYQHHVKGYN